MTTKLTKNPCITRWIAWFVLIAFAAGCTTMNPVYGTDAASYAATIEVGDKIRITRTDLSTVEFKVSSISNTGIAGDGIFVAYSDIERVEAVQSNKALIGAIVVLGVIAVAAGAGVGVGIPDTAPTL